MFGLFSKKKQQTEKMVEKIPPPIENFGDDFENDDEEIEKIEDPKTAEKKEPLTEKEKNDLDYQIQGWESQLIDQSVKLNKKEIDSINQKIKEARNKLNPEEARKQELKQIQEAPLIVVKKKKSMLGSVLYDVFILSIFILFVLSLLTVVVGIVWVLLGIVAYAKLHKNRGIFWSIVFGPFNYI
jgi:hypothetical protein